MLVTRQGINFGPNYIVHPNTNQFWEYYAGNTFTETPYYNDNTYIGIFSGDTLPTIPFNFELDEKTEEEINILLLERYGTDEEGSPYVYYSDGEFIDNRPLDDDLI